MKRELARPASPQESLEATIATREGRKEELQQERSEIEAQYEAMMAEFEERLAANARSVEVEDVAIKKMQELLQKISELTLV